MKRRTAIQPAQFTALHATHTIPLASARVPAMAVSTCETDRILVRDDLERAPDALAGTGYQFQ